MSNPKNESYIQVLNTQTEFELSLDDKSFEEELKQLAEQVMELSETSDVNEAESTRSDLKADAGSLPSVLIDEKLLEELNSIPDRFGFKIGDVADLLGIKQYVLRYWEEEFDILNPKKASNNQRLYTKKDVENAFLIRKLLYRDKFSIEGARRALKDVKFQLKKEKEYNKDFTQAIQRIEFAQAQIKNFVDEIKKTKKLFN